MLSATYGLETEKLTSVVQHKVSICLQLVESDLEDASKNPVDDLDEWDDAESKTEAKEPSKGGNKVDRTHSDASLKLLENYRLKIFITLFLPITVSFPKKMLTTAMSSSQAL